MAVSGRKVSDLQDSFSRGSADDFGHCCDFCLTEGQNVAAHGYCYDCCEYLCNNCFKFHKKTSATKNHQLVDKDNMGKHSVLPKPSDVCTEKCSIHANEVIKYFCLHHEEIGCNDCMIMKHRTCKLDYIPDKCAGIGESDEYRQTLKELEQKLKEADGVLNKAAVKDKEVDESHLRAMKDIAKKRQEINDHFDAIQRKTETDVSKNKATGKQEVLAVVTSCTNYTSNIKKLQSNIQNSKASNQNGQLFIEIKRAKSELQSREIQQAEMSLDKTTTQIAFNINKDVEGMLSVMSFGKLTDVDTSFKTIRALAATTRGKETFNTLQHKMNMEIGKIGSISGCVTLSSDKLVLADNLNTRLLVFNTEKYVVTEKKTLDSRPLDIALLPHDQIAVTVPAKKQILIMTTAGTLSTDRSINVEGVCRGIIYHQNCLYVLCWCSSCLYVLDMKGNIKNTISLADRSVFDSPYYIALSEDFSLIYVSNWGNNSIASITLRGEISAVYKNKDLSGPLGMLLLGDGSLLVVCEKNHTIHHVSADLKQGRKVMECLPSPWSMCYSNDRSKVHVTCENNDKLQVLSVIYKM